MPNAEEHPAAAEVADEVDRRCRLAAGAPEVGERARERDVVDVVTRGLRHRALLPPPGHAPVHELRVAGEAVVGPKSHAFGDPGPEALEQRVGVLDKAQDRFHAVGVLEVDADRPAPAGQRVVVRAVEHERVHLTGAVDAHDVGAHVGEQHACERPGTDPGQLDDLDALQRSHDALPSPMVRRIYRGPAVRPEQRLRRGRRTLRATTLRPRPRTRSASEPCGGLTATSKSASSRPIVSRSCPDLVGQQVEPLRRVHVHRVHAVPARGAPERTDGPGPGSGDPDRRSRLLHRTGRERGCVHSQVPAVEVDALAAPQRVDDSQRLVESLGAHAVAPVLAECLVLLGRWPPEADADDDAPARELIEARDLAGELVRPPPRQRRHHRAETDPFRRQRDRRQRDRHIRGRLFEPDVVPDEEAVPTVCLGRRRELGQHSGVGEVAEDVHVDRVLHRSLLPAQGPTITRCGRAASPMWR